MMSFWKYIIIWLLWIAGMSWCSADNLPNFTDDFANQLSAGSDRVFSPTQIGIQTNLSITDNMRNLFYPSWTNGGGQIYQLLRTIGIGILVIFVIITGIAFLQSGGNDAELKKAQNSFLYMTYGAVLFFGVTFIFSKLWLETTVWSKEILSNFQWGLMLQVLGFLKAAAFFVAIVMIVRYGFQMIRSYEKEDQLKLGKTGVINVLAALVFMKVIDYIFFIAQSSDFKSKVGDGIITASKIAGYIIGAMMLLAVFYAGGLLITGEGESDKLKKAKGILKTVFFVGLTIFLFLLITYQVFKDLT